MPIISYSTFPAVKNSAVPLTPAIATFSGPQAAAILRILPKQKISIDVKDRKDPSKDELYINANHIHRNNWRYNEQHGDRRCLEYAQDAQPESFQNEKLAGFIEFDDTYHTGAGFAQVGNTKSAVQAALVIAEYTIDRSPETDCGAYVATDANILHWDTTSSKWKQATFTQNVIKFLYWYDDDDKVKVKFICTGDGSNDEWEPDRFSFVPIVDKHGNTKIIFGFMGAPPSAMLRKMIYFPFKMAIELDFLGQIILGGASLHRQYSDQGTVFGLKGTLVNPTSAVGTYSLSQNAERAGVFEVNSNLMDKRRKLSQSAESAGVFKITHDEVMLVDGFTQKCKHCGNKVTWGTGREEKEIHRGGYVELSEDGHHITKSSFGAVGKRVYAQ
jgi:hypothetical protein